MSGEWLSKGPSPAQSMTTNYVVRPGTQCTGKAHFIRAGQPLCMALKRPDGKPVLGPFLCSWVALRAFDKHCGLCRRVLGAEGGHVDLGTFDLPAGLKGIA